MGGDEIPLPLSVVQERELVVTGTFRYANTWPTAIALVASGAVDVDRLVTGRYGLGEAEDALTAARRDPHLGQGRRHSPVLTVMSAATQDRGVSWLPSPTTTPPGSLPGF